MIKSKKKKNLGSINPIHVIHLLIKCVVYNQLLKVLQINEHY